MLLLLITTLSLTDAVTLNGSSEYAVTGSNFTLICDVPEEATLVRFYRRPDVIVPAGSIQVSEDQCYNTLASPPVPCTADVCSCVSSGGNLGSVFRWIIQPKTVDHGSMWYCRRTNRNLPIKTEDSTDYTLKIANAVSLNGSTDYATPGADFTLTCDVPEEATLVQFYRFPDIFSVGGIQVAVDQCYNVKTNPATPCTSDVCSCVASGGNLGTVFRWIIQPQTADHGSVWYCRRINFNFTVHTLDSPNFTLNVADGPGNSISLSPSDITYTRTEGDTLPDITCTADCRPGCTFVWTRPDNTNLTHSSVLSLGQLDRSEEGMYRCTARNVAGESFISFNLTIKYRPYVVISPSTNPLILEEGQTGVALQCAVTLTNPPVSSMVWTRGSTVVSRTGIYSLPPVTQGYAGVYTCTANNSAGTSTANITLEVVLLPTVPELLGITNVTSSSVTLKWLPRERTASSHTLSIEYVCVECDDMRSIPIDTVSHREFQLTTLTDLLSWTQYTVNLTSTNKLGTRVSAGLVVATAPQPTECITAVPSGQEAATSSTSVALVAVGVVLIVIGIISLGTAFVIYRKGRLLPRPSLQQDRVKTPVTFSDIIHSENDEQPNHTEDGTQYQELNLNDIGAPSHYDSTTAAEADNIDANRTQYQELNLNDIGAPSHYDSTTAAEADNIDANRMGNDGVSPYANITQD